jgi:broad specificity phosphatase PhoE
MAGLAGLAGVKPDPDLLEWDYGGYEHEQPTTISA